MIKLWQVLWRLITILCIDLSGYLIIPFALIFVRESDEHLPRIFSWWDEYHYGINGDPYWRGPEHANGEERSYWWRVRWLYRNANGFQNAVLGIKTTDIVQITYMGDPDISDQPVPRSGKLWVYAICKNEEQFWCLYIVHQYFNLPLCFRLYVGWKIRDVLNAYMRYGKLHQDPEAKEIAQFAISIAPCRRFGRRHVTHTT